MPSLTFPLPLALASRQPVDHSISRIHPLQTRLLSLSPLLSYTTRTSLVVSSSRTIISSRAHPYTSFSHSKKHRSRSSSCLNPSRYFPRRFRPPSRLRPLRDPSPLYLSFTSSQSVTITHAAPVSASAPEQPDNGTSAIGESAQWRTARECRWRWRRLKGDAQGAARCLLVRRRGALSYIPVHLTAMNNCLAWPSPRAPLTQQDDPDCLLCAEPLDLSDLNFKPCQCGMQVSRTRMSAADRAYDRYASSATTSS